MTDEEKKAKVIQGLKWTPLGHDEQPEPCQFCAEEDESFPWDPEEVPGELRWTDWLVTIGVGLLFAAGFAYALTRGLR